MANLISSEKTPWKAIGIVITISILYLSFTAIFIGLKPEHFYIIGFYNALFVFSSKTRKFILAFTVFLIFGILYDIMKVFPNYWFNNVDIASLYHFEKSVFGFLYHKQLYTPNEFFAAHHCSFLDVYCGISYLNWVPVPLAFGTWLYFKNKQQFLQFSLTFLFVNIIGFCIYYVHPAAPPWYIGMYGSDLNLNVSGNPGGLIRFDNFFHLKVFGSIYSRNSNVFAAIPSLHSSYPVIVLFYAIKNNVKWVKYLLILFMVSIWFTAVYSGHHYVTDVLLGISCALVGIIIFQKLLLKWNWFQKFINKYEFAIS